VNVLQAQRKNPHGKAALKNEPNATYQ